MAMYPMYPIKWDRVENTNRLESPEPDFVLREEFCYPGVRVIVEFVRYQDTYAGSIAEMYQVRFVGPAGEHVLQRAKKDDDNVWGRRTAKEKAQALASDSTWLAAHGIIGGETK